METKRPEFLDVTRTEIDPSPTRVNPDRAAANGPDAADGEAVETWHPVTIGHYRIVRLLGEGGMGSVYLAEQENPHRIVALKVIKPGFASIELLRRFEREGHALGRLQHPGIAHIYEAGTADSGFGPQPYFAMEFIAGLSLLKFAKERHLNVRARLELMAKICDAVNHAHQRGIIHRDLKPDNILIDDAGQPKVLDFGVARVTDSDAEATRQTDLGQIIGTLTYMSPEQVQPDSQEQELDIRSDVYALGVITYELLARKLPYDTKRSALHEIVHAIREVEPAPLSSVHRFYRGDIATIVAKALEKDKARRYTSAAEFSADIRRYLANQPIVARPPTTRYQLQKFVQRHRALVVGTAAVFLALIAAVVISTRQAVKARRAEAAANAVNDFLQNDLLAQASAANQSGPNTKPDPDLKVRTALDRAAERIAGKFDKQPDVEAAIRDTIGQTYIDLGLYPQAQKQLELALDLHRRMEGAKSPKTLNTARLLGEVLERQTNHVPADAILSQTLQTMRQVLGPEHPDTLKTMNMLALVYGNEDKFAQSEALQTQTLEISRRVLGPEHPFTLLCMHRLGILYNREFKYPQAEALHSQSVEIYRRALGPEHPDTLDAILNVGVVYKDEGKYAQAEELLSQLVETERRVLGPDHHSRVISMDALGDVYSLEGKYAQAEELYIETREINRRTLGPEHPDTLFSRNLLAIAYDREGKYAQAEELLSQMLPTVRQVLGPENDQTVWCMNNLGNVYNDEGKYAQAEALYGQALEIARRVMIPEHAYMLTTLNGLAVVYTREGKYGLAETYATQALAGRRHMLGPDNPSTLASAASLALIYESQGKFTQSESLAREVEETERTKRPDNWRRFWAESLLGASLAGETHYAEAEPLLLEGYRGMLARIDKIAVQEQRDLDRAREWIVQMYVAWGMPKKAAEWRHA